MNSILLRAGDQKTCAIQFFPHMPFLSWPITGGPVQCGLFEANNHITIVMSGKSYVIYTLKGG